jgi:hypothetical protein
MQALPVNLAGVLEAVKCVIRKKSSKSPLVRRSSFENLGLSWRRHGFIGDTDCRDNPTYN